MIDDERIQRYRAIVPQMQGKDVLVIGSGEGYGAKMLSVAARSVVGLDSDEAVVINARRKYATDRWREPQGNLVYFHGRLCDLDGDQFDLVVSLGEIKEPSEVRRVMRPGGEIVIA